ncbi:MotA/TolQ/ExbB proton channel family protein [Vibrio sp. HN007]|uniref:MotA/TolQ/ExbB proton channel family protein n=1 Tax=Vibrio iocasae TaxID=3098914 RepID=UPI0035D4FF4A
MRPLKSFLITTLIASSVLGGGAAYAQSDLLTTTKQAHADEREHNIQREGRFLNEEEKLRYTRDQLLARKQLLETSIDNLSSNFSENEQILAGKEKTLHLESGSLGELFGVVRQVAKELNVELAGSVTAIEQSENIAQVKSIASAKKLPSRSELYALWNTFNDQLQAGSKINEVVVPVVQSDGVIKQEQVLRIGAFGLTDSNGYLKWGGEKLGASAYSVQPEFTPSLSNLGQGDQLIAFDPTKGKLLEQLAMKPTLKQRIEQGGAVGKVILALLIVGLLIGLVQGAFLLSSRMKINAQLKNTDTIGNNALGRVLSVYKYDESPNVEALELRLFETVLDEQQKLERGLSMIKLLAALSPMLGLLGTVTGMIETFQVITQFGNADPRIMAGGISTALITTVLGLVSAMPLLFMHNVLSSQAESIRTILEKQGVGMVAQRAEKEMELSH